MINEEAIKIWNELGITRVNMNFTCGGDSMGDYDFTFFKDDNEIELNQELYSYFENEVYENVEFYVNSDGHYMGESGNVEITLEDDVFNYVKNSEYEYNESDSCEIDYEITKNEFNLINEKISNINGGSFDNENNINYKNDCIITDEEEDLINKLMERITRFSDNYVFEDEIGEYQDETSRWESVADNNNVLTFEKDGYYYVKINITQDFYVFKKD